MDIVALFKQQSETITDHHLFHNVCVFAGGHQIVLRAMIDSNLPFNLIFQRSIAQQGIFGDCEDISPAQNLNEAGIRLY